MAHETLRRLLGPAGFVTRKALDRLIQAYNEAGRKQEATQWRKYRRETEVGSP